MAIYVRDPTTGQYKPLIIATPDNQARLYQQLLNNRIMLLKALQKAGLSVSKTPDYIYSDIFTDADGWQNTIDEWNAHYISAEGCHASDSASKSIDGPTSPLSNSGILDDLVFYISYIGSEYPIWKPLYLQFESWGTTTINLTLTRTDTGETLLTLNNITLSGVTQVDVSQCPFMPPKTEIEVYVDFVSGDAISDDGGYTYQKTLSANDIVVKAGTPPNESYYYLPAVNRYGGNTPFPLVGVLLSIVGTDFYLKTKTFTFPSPIKQLLVFADRELVNNAQEMEVEVYDTNDTLLASGNIGELIDISEYNKSSVYLKLKLHGSGSAYTKCYGYAVAFWL